MEVKLRNLNGIQDAICSIFVSKGNLTPEKEQEIDECWAFYDACTTIDYIPNDEYDKRTETYDKTVKMYKKMLEIGAKHTTVIRFIDFSFTVRGLHRAAQDDFDAHSHRLNNRIIRSSTRICKFTGGDKSDYYKDKILTLREVLNLLNIELPEEITTPEGKVYKSAPNGYISVDAVNSEPNEWDIQRGLYYLAIPSNFIAKCDLFEFAHIYKMRNKNTFAHPELRDMIESLTDQLAEKLFMTPDECREYLMKIPN